MNVEINRIFYLLAEERIDIKEAKNRVLNLFDVVNRRELLLAYNEWLKVNATDLQPKAEDVDDFLSQ